MVLIEVVDDKDRKHKRPKVEDGIQGHSTDTDDSDSYTGTDIDDEEEEEDEGSQKGRSTCINKDDSDSDTNSCGYDDGRYDIDEDDVSSVEYEKESVSEEDQVFRRYLKQIKVSRGFDVDIFPKRVIGGLRPVDITAAFDELKKCAEFAIKWHNRKKTEQLEFVRILKAIEGSTVGYIYYITLEARIKSSEKTKVYQAKVEDDFLYKKMILYIFRPKPGQE